MGVLLLFPFHNEFCESLESIVLFPVHVRFDFSIEAYGDTLFRQVFRDAGRASFVMVDGVSGACVIDAGAEINVRHWRVLLGFTIDESEKNTGRLYQSR